MRAVLDASVVVRALIVRRSEARTWLERLAQNELEAVVPDLIFAEVAQAFAGYVRQGMLSRGDALRRVGFVGSLPFRVRPLASIAPTALAVAVDRGLSVQDACYATLAVAEPALLVTADRRLAAAVEEAELIR